jgi:hypothetical protein
MPGPVSISSIVTPRPADLVRTINWPPVSIACTALINKFNNCRAKRLAIKAHFRQFWIKKADQLNACLSSPGLQRSREV